MTTQPYEPSHPQLRRELGLGGATMMGLGSIIGTGAFVSIGIAAGIAGPAVVLALVLAGFVAMCNALSSAQLAASRPVSGGTYEYGYAYLSPALGFTAGWMFLCAKTASAATAALGFAGYLLHVLGVAGGGPLVPVAMGAAAILTAVVLAGMRQSNWTNIFIVSITLASLSTFVLVGLPGVVRSGGQMFTPFFQSPSDGAPGAAAGVLHAAALMFVAYTGYGRIATLGEEVRDPQKLIPRAIVITLVIAAGLYIAVALVAVGTLGAGGLASATRAQAAPLEAVARRFQVPGVPQWVAIGAVTAMLGVLLNLILGLSRVLLAMGRRGDMPRVLTRLNRSQTTPSLAVIVVGTAIAALASIGSVKTTWSFSAFTVLVYYAITNLAALRMPRESRLYSPAYPGCGLVACLFLAFWVEWPIWVAGLGLIAIGLLWHAAARGVARSTDHAPP